MQETSSSSTPACIHRQSSAEPQEEKPSPNLASVPQPTVSSTSPPRLSTWLALCKKTPTKGSRFVSNQTRRLRGIYSVGSRSAAQHYLISRFGLYCTSQAPQSHLPETLSDMGHLHFLHSNNLRQINKAEFNFRWLNEASADGKPQSTAACETKVEMHALHTTPNNLNFWPYNYMYRNQQDTNEMITCLSTENSQLLLLIFLYSRN